MRSLEPDLMVDLYLYPTEPGGTSSSIRLGYLCPCTTDRRLDESWDGFPLLESEMLAGERRRVGFAFMAGPKAAQALSANGHFYLPGGEAVIV